MDISGLDCNKKLQGAGHFFIINIELQALGYVWAPTQRTETIALE
jgi:hypothetical protein